MNHQTHQIWTLLKQNGIVQGDQPETGVTDSPWYVKTLLAFSGWLAAIFIIGFIASAFEMVFKNNGASAIVGALMIAGAFALFRISVNEFVEHLGFATSIAGQALIVYSIFRVANQHEVTAWLLIALLQGLLVVLMPNFAHSVFSTLVAATALSFAFNEMHIPYVIGGVVTFGASFCWINEFRYPQQIKKIQAIGYGLILALIAWKGATLLGKFIFGELFSKKHEYWAQPWVGELMIGAVTLYVVWSLLQRYRQPVKGLLSISTLLITLLVCAVSIKAQGITVGMVIICLGYYSLNRILLGLGIVSLLFYISTYYYLLDTTLLDKSQSLLMIGLVFIFARWLMHRIFPEHKEVLHG